MQCYAGLVDTVQSPLALVVDHNLREGSASEALHACSIAEQLGVEAKLFKLGLSTAWPPSNKSDVLSLARQLRYAEIYHHCCRENIFTLMTGHHAGNCLPDVIWLMQIEGYACIMH